MLILFCLVKKYNHPIYVPNYFIVATSSARKILLKLSHVLFNLIKKIYC